MVQAAAYRMLSQDPRHLTSMVGTNWTESGHPWDGPKAQLPPASTGPSSEERIGRLFGWYENALATKDVDNAVASNCNAEEMSRRGDSYHHVALCCDPVLHRFGITAAQLIKQNVY